MRGFIFDSLSFSMFRQHKPTCFVISAEQREWRNLARKRCGEKRFCFTLGSPLWGEGKDGAVFGTTPRSVQDPSTDARDDKESICFQRSFDSLRSLRMTK